jgi:uncharacterized protein YneF (UPF0154 family)
MTIFYCLLCLVLGFIGGMALTKWLIRRGINKADISSDDRRMIRDILGIPQ